MIDRASGPDNRTIERAPTPGGVAMAAMVAVVLTEVPAEIVLRCFVVLWRQIRKGRFARGLEPRGAFSGVDRTKLEAPVGRGHARAGAKREEPSCF